ncbi:Nucleolar complex protein 3-like protein [Frankliniella fusca]|uniref:Nucleolar complex protein 3-like protein n=1 Tax=Frankliniella fusca TaxID=407009 RepID=A0AAE1GVD5_9NEOP|nr:Nucleolar complex protein 3-like protein [Frankliniella fusca]
MLVTAAAVTIAVLLIGNIEPNHGPFPCKMCSVVPKTITRSMRHQHLHASRNKAFVYKCPSEGCERFATPSFGFLKYHVSMLHRDTLHQDPSATKKIFCPYISNANECPFSTLSLWEFVQHFYVHLDAGNKVVCPIDGCERTKDFSKKSTLQTHLSQHHRNWRAEGCPKEQFTREIIVTPQQSPTIQSGETEFLPVNDEFQTDDNCDGNDVSHELLNDDIILDSIAKFYLHLYAENLLPQDTIQEIFESLVFLTEVIQSRIKLVLSKELEKCDIPVDKVNLICHKVMMADLLYSSHHKSCPGTSLTLDYIRRKYFSANFGFKGPVQLNLGENEPDSTDTLQYVSIEQSLTTLLEDDSIKQEIEASFFRAPTPENEVRDYYDGTLFKSEDHSPKEIHLNLYEDSFNPVMNALGSAKNKYKDLVVYFTIANFRPHLRSRIATKYLVMICRESIFKTIGAKKCLKEMMLELHK